MIKLVAAVLVLASCQMAGKDRLPSSGIPDIDAVREEVRKSPTDSGNYMRRRAVLHRWWRFLWRQGINMDNFDETGKRLSEAIGEEAYSCLDDAFAALEMIQESPERIREIEPEENETGKQTFTDWPFYHGTDSYGTGYSPDKGAAKGRIAWKFPKGHNFTAKPVVDGPRIYATSMGADVVVFCIEASSGKILWKGTQDNHQFYGSTGADVDPVIEGNLVMTRAWPSPEALCYDKITGERIAVNKEYDCRYVSGNYREEDGVLVKYCGTAKEWEYSPETMNRNAACQFSGVLEYGERIYVGTSDSSVIALSASGMKQWELKLDDWVRSRPLYLDGRLYVSTMGGRLYSIAERKNRPVIRWSRQINRHGSIVDLVGCNGDILISSRDLMLYCCDRKGDIKWKCGLLDGCFVGDKYIMSESLSGIQSSPVIVDGVVYVTGTDGFLNAIDIETGEELWKFEAKGSISCTPVCIGGIVYFGETYRSEGRFYAIEAGTGRLVWKSDAFGKVWTGAAYNDGILFIGSMDGFMYGVKPETGEIIWSYYSGNDTPLEDLPLDSPHRHGFPPGVYSNPVADSCNVYFGSWAGYYFALDQKTGELVWRIQTNGGNPDGGFPDSAAPVILEDNIYVQKLGSRIASIDKLEGVTDSEWKAPDGFLQNGTVSGKGQILFGSCIYGLTNLPIYVKTVAFDCPDGVLREKWIFEGGGGVTSPVMNDDRLFTGSSGDVFFNCISTETGKIIWRLYTGGVMLENTPAIYGDKVVAQFDNCWLIAFE